MKRLATANAFGQTGAGLAFVTGGAGIAISIGGGSDSLRYALRDKTPADLEKAGREMLASMGITKAEMDSFYGIPNLTPTDKAVIVEALNSLGGAGGREIFLANAAKANSIEMGFFYRRQTELIAAFNKHVTPVRGFVRLGGAPMLETAKGTISILPVDYLYWSPPLEGSPPAQDTAAKCGSPAGRVRWPRRSSPRFGWTSVSKAGAKLGQ